MFGQGTHRNTGHTNAEEWGMSKLSKAVLGFLADENGPTAVEYAVMLALIIVVCIAAITALGTNSSNTFSYISSIIGGTGS
jgi:pilus assembly protein Flp/PilA